MEFIDRYDQLWEYPRKCCTVIHFYHNYNKNKILLSITNLSIQDNVLTSTQNRLTTDFVTRSLDNKIQTQHTLFYHRNIFVEKIDSLSPFFSHFHFIAFTIKETK